MLIIILHRLYACVLRDVNAALPVPALDLPAILPRPFLHWDAYTLMDSGMEPGSTVTEWINTGTNPISMLGRGRYINGPYLWHDEGRPHIQFDRGSFWKYAWFEAAAPITFPAYPKPNAGLTIFFVGSMHAWIDDNEFGAYNEKVLSFANSDGQGPWNMSLSFGRDAWSNNMAINWFNTRDRANMVQSYFADRGPLYWQIHVWRLAENYYPVVSYKRNPGRWETVTRNYPLDAETAAPAMPRTLESCYIGKSHFTDDRYFDGNIREIAIYNEAFSDEQIEAEYARLQMKWARLSKYAKSCTRALSTLAECH